MFGMQSDLEDEDLKFVEVEPLIQEALNEFHYVLPPHQCCAAHTLNLVAVKRATDSALVYCRPLARALLQGVETRFGNILNEKKLTIAAGLIPSLKFTWLEGQEKEEALRTFKEELGSNEAAPLEKNDYCDTSDDEANFFNVVKRGEVFPASDELCTSTEIESLHQLPILKRAFIKANASLPSSAAVEQLFSSAKGSRARLSRLGVLAFLGIDPPVLGGVKELATPSQPDPPNKRLGPEFCSPFVFESSNAAKFPWLADRWWEMSLGL
ncbi:hypothetical protein J437_LFUL016152 [Ladona fulva]|uniref:HAT C-terminal dimerisation domain-containing protein n=1 Tax=Ladona fulva TaxID=123851 RepID=A0A8K0KKY1_LADFU|nr:hypothetical protein J437_LFUL016152 [Ladona fulva]